MKTSKRSGELMGVVRIVILNRLVRIWFIGKVDLSKEVRDFQAYV